MECMSPTRNDMIWSEKIKHASAEAAEMETDRQATAVRAAFQSDTGESGGSRVTAGVRVQGRGKYRVDIESTSASLDGWENGKGGSTRSWGLRRVALVGL